nr:unnamed protein product [Callosobruchus analis]
MDESDTFDISDPDLQEQLKKKMAINVKKDGKWGTYRHMLIQRETYTKVEHCVANTMVKGDLTSLRWTEGPLTSNSTLPLEKDLIYEDENNGLDTMKEAEHSENLSIGGESYWASFRISFWPGDSGRASAAQHTFAVFALNRSPSIKIIYEKLEVSQSNVLPVNKIHNEPLGMIGMSLYRVVKFCKESFDRNNLINSNDKYKFQRTKRIHGNPLLGIDYLDSQRIPSEALVPDSMSLEEAATVPTVYGTLAYGLLYVS